MTRLKEIMQALLLIALTLGVITAVCWGMIFFSGNAAAEPHQHGVELTETSPEAQAMLQANGFASLVFVETGMGASISGLKFGGVPAIVNLNVFDGTRTLRASEQGSSRYRVEPNMGTYTNGHSVTFDGFRATTWFEIMFARPDTMALASYSVTVTLDGIGDLELHPTPSDS